MVQSPIVIPRVIGGPSLQGRRKGMQNSVASSASGATNPYVIFIISGSTPEGFGGLLCRAGLFLVPLCK